MIKNKSNLKVMGEKAKEIAIIDAEDRIYKEVKKILKWTVGKIGLKKELKTICRGRHWSAP